MFERDDSASWQLEFAIIIVVIGITTLLAATGMKSVVLNLFFLPVILAGFHLGRYRAGIFAFFSVLCASIVVFLGRPEFVAENDVTVIGLSLVTWGAVLCLSALLVGTLSDERSNKAQDLHEAYIGVVEVLSRYLQSANPMLEAKSKRVARLSQMVARQLKLSRQDIDDIGVAALLHDVGNIELTAKVLQNAMGNAKQEQTQFVERTFQGTDVVQSFGSVLRGALPLLVKQHNGIREERESTRFSRGTQVGASIICAVRAYDSLTHPSWDDAAFSSQDTIEQLRRDGEQYPPFVIDALERVATSAAVPNDTGLFAGAGV